MTVAFYRNSHTSANKLNDDYIVELSKEALLFDDAFKLGSTPCMCLKLKVLKNTIGDFEKILVYENNALTATLILDSVDREDEVFDTYTLVDYMVNFNVKYDGSALVGSTLLAIVQDICFKSGTSLDSSSTNFNGNDKIITWYDDTISGRDYISYVAELNGGFAYIKPDGKLAFAQFTANNSSVDTIDVAMCESFKLGAFHKINRVVYDNGLAIWEVSTPDDDGDTVYLNSNNAFITEESDIAAIHNIVKGFEFYSLEVSKCPIGAAKVGELITFTLNGVNYKTIAQIDQSYGLGWIGGYSCDLANAYEEETQVIDPQVSNAVKTVKTIIDRDLGSFKLIVNNHFNDIDNTLTEHQTMIEANENRIDLVAEETEGNSKKTNRIRITPVETQFIGQDLQPDEQPDNYVGVNSSRVAVYVDRAEKVKIAADGIHSPEYNIARDNSNSWVLTTTNGGKTMTISRR